MFSNEIAMQPTPVDAKMPPVRSKNTKNNDRFDYLNFGKEAADESEDNYEDDFEKDESKRQTGGLKLDNNIASVNQRNSIVDIQQQYESPENKSMASGKPATFNTKKHNESPGKFDLFKLGGKDSTADDN